MREIAVLRSMSAMPRISVILVNYRAPEFTGHTLRSLQRAIYAIPHEIIVVDNASGDHSLTYLRQHFPTIHYIALKENIGFGRANNLALERATGDWVWILNPDTLVPESLPQQLLQESERRSNLGGIGVRMIDGSGRFLPESKRGKPMPWASACKLLGWANRFPKSRWFAQYYQGHIDPKQSTEIPVLAGASMFASRELLTTLGGFDPRYFMYGEDIDLSVRLASEGRKNYYLAHTPLLHFKGESTDTQSPSYIEHFYGAMELYVERYHPNLSGWMYRQVIGWIKNRKLRKLASRPNTPTTIPSQQRKHWKLFGDVDDIKIWEERLVSLHPLSISHTTDLPVSDDAQIAYLMVIGNNTSLEHILTHLAEHPVSGTQVWWAFPELPAMVRSGEVVKW